MIPATQRAIQQDSLGNLRVVSEAEIPHVPPGYALVRTRAVALNPSDYKILKNFPLSGAFVGIDFFGTVIKTGEGVPHGGIRIGTMVSGTSFGFSATHRLVNGAFSEYVLTRADLLLRIPLSQHVHTIHRLEAATLGTAIATSILSLWSREGLDLRSTPDNPDLSKTPIPVLVYGGSTATGTIAIQLLKLAGYDPIAICSPRNFPLVRDRGASAVFDYSRADLVTEIKSYTSDKLKYVLDCISDERSVTICYSAIQRPGGRYVALEHLPDDLVSKRRAIHHYFVLAAECSGEEVNLGHEWYDRPPNYDKHNLVVHHIATMQRLLDEGLLKPHPIKVLGRGLENVIQGLDLLASGRISGQKLVVDLEVGGV